MHNTLTRLQNTFSYLTSCAFVIALVISTVSLLPIINNTPAGRRPPPPPNASLSVRNVQVVRGRPHYYSSRREEYAHVRFDLDADLSPLFDWNTKQVFAYVSAEYPAQEGQEMAGSVRDGGGDGHLASGGGRPGRPGTNKAVIWDTIIPAPASRWSVANMKETFFPAKVNKGAGKGNRRQTPKPGKEEAKTAGVGRPGLLTLKNQKPKYQITDPSGIISSRANVTLTLGWNVQPWVGALMWDRGMLEDKNGGPAGADGSWNLPFLKHQWQGGMLPRSGTFDFPPIKGPQRTSEVVKDKDGPQTPEPAEASGVV